MVEVRSLKKLTCHLGPTHYVEPGTSSTVGPERQGNILWYGSVGTSKWRPKKVSAPKDFYLAKYDSSYATFHTYDTL
jgi:hypothetical protein